MTNAEIISTCAVIISIGSAIWSVVSYNFSRNNTTFLECTVKNFIIPQGLEPLKQFIATHNKSLDDIIAALRENPVNRASVFEIYNIIHKDYLELGSKIIVVDQFLDGMLNIVLTELDNFEDMLADLLNQLDSGSIVTYKDVNLIKKQLNSPLFHALKIFPKIRRSTINR